MLCLERARDLSVSPAHGTASFVVWDYFPIARVCAYWYNLGVTIQSDGPAAVLRQCLRHYQINLRDVVGLSTGSQHSQIRK